MKDADLELLYDLPEGECDLSGVTGVRTKTIRAGCSLEVMAYPICQQCPATKRAAKARRTSPAMEKINAANITRRIYRLIEENFTEAAVVFTGTYEYPPAVDYGLCNLEEVRELYDRLNLPEDESRVKKDWRNFAARLRRVVKAAGGDVHDFKWLQITEEGTKPPVWGLPPKYHIHAVIEGPGLTRDTIEAAWGHGFVQTRRFDRETDGAARLARYLTKQHRGGRWWSHSRNLREPQPRVSDRRVSRRRLLRLAAGIKAEQKAIFEKLYPRHKLVELTVSFSDFMPGAYIYARLRRAPLKEPPWERCGTRNRQRPYAAGRGADAVACRPDHKRHGHFFTSLK